MKYAYNLHQPELSATVEDWMSMQEPGKDSGKWLLFDGAVLGEKITKQLIKMLPVGGIHNVFANSPLATYGLHSPHLVQLRSTAAAKNLLPTMLGNMNGFPAVSFVDANTDGALVCRYLSWLAQARANDGMDLYCRFADTRITPSLMKALVDEQHLTLGQCIHEWRVVNRHGVLNTVQSSAVKKRPVSVAQHPSHHLIEQFRLSDQQFLMMMNSAETDEIFQMLCEGAPDLVPEMDRGDFHVRLARLVAAARRQGLENTRDIYQFSVIALTTRDEFYLSSALDGCWTRLNARQDDFGSLVASWPDEIWNDLASVREKAIGTSMQGGTS